MACDDPVVFIGCDGQPLPTGVDAFGNTTVVVCSGTTGSGFTVHEYSLSVDGGPNPASCNTNGTYAYDTDEQCFTHVCYEGVWHEWCGTTTQPVDPPTFISEPTDFCVDSSTGDVTQCWEVQDGTVTGFRWRTVSPLGPWNLV